MFINQLKNKIIAIFGFNNEIRKLANFLIKNQAVVFVVDDSEKNFLFEGKDLINFVDRNKVDWPVVDTLIVWQDDKNLIEKAKNNNCEVCSIIDFFQKYFQKYNYVGLIGDTGSFISSKILKYLFCQMEEKLNYKFCETNNLFTLSRFGSTKNYIFELNQVIFNFLQSPHFNNIILFDLKYNKDSLFKIKDIILNQNKNDIVVFNIDDQEVKEFYNSIRNSENCKSKLIPISINKILQEGISFVNSEIYLNIENINKEYLTNEFKNLNGNQNKINILSVFALMVSLGFSPNEIIENLYRFKNSNDVFELISHKDNFTFINDIKNKNKLQSLISFDNIYWILCIDKIKFDFDEFQKLIGHFKKIKYVFIMGMYNDEIIKIFRENNMEYFVIYEMKNIFKKIKELMSLEKKEEKINVVLSSINDIENSSFYEKCGYDFEKLVNMES